MNTEITRLRRYEDDLHVSGTGVVILGAWSIIRILIELVLNTKDFIDLDEIDSVGAKAVTTALVLGLIAILSFIIMKVHLYIGLNAIKAAQGKPYKKGYVLAAIIFTVLSVLSLIVYKDEFNDLTRIDTTIASILVDLTTIYLFIVVIVSSFKIKKIKNED